MNQPAAWLVAALITRVAGVALRRAHFHAALTSRKPPSGPVTGLWMGSGVLVGRLLLYPSGRHSWLPRSPTALAPLLLACVLTAAWQLAAPLSPVAVAGAFVMAAAGTPIALPARRLWWVVRPRPPARAARGTGARRMAYRWVALAYLMGAGTGTAGSMVAVGAPGAGASPDAREDTSGEFAATLGAIPSPYVRAVQIGSLERLRRQ